MSRQGEKFTKNNIYLDNIIYYILLLYYYREPKMCRAYHKLANIIHALALTYRPTKGIVVQLWPLTESGGSKHYIYNLFIIFIVHMFYYICSDSRV